MAGYHNFSKSNNAVSAELHGRYPASTCARLLGVPLQWVKRQRTREWHHTSSRYNVTNYYDLELLLETLETSDGQAELAEVYAELSAQKSAKPVILTGCTVFWLDWVGTRNHPRVIERSVDNATVTIPAGKFVTVSTPNGRPFKKGRNTKGFRVVLDGKTVNL